MITITYNGEVRALDAPLSIAAFLHAEGLTGARIAVEINEAICPKSAYATTMLADGDRLEIIHAVGGG